MVKKNLEDIYNFLDSIPACDRRTDGRTDILPRHSLRYAYASRSKNYIVKHLLKMFFTEDEVLMGYTLIKISVRDFYRTSAH